MKVVAYLLSALAVTYSFADQGERQRKEDWVRGYLHDPDKLFRSLFSIGSVQVYSNTNEVKQSPEGYRAIRGQLYHVLIDDLSEIALGRSYIGEGGAISLRQPALELGEKKTMKILGEWERLSFILEMDGRTMTGQAVKDGSEILCTWKRSCSEDLIARIEGILQSSASHNGGKPPPELGVEGAE